MSLMRHASLVRLIPPEPARPRRRRGWVIGVSLLLHALLLAALLLVARRPELEEGAAASYELRFEGSDSGAGTQGSTPEGTPDSAPAPVAGPPPAATSPVEALPGPVTPPVTTPPVPDAPPQLMSPPVPELARPTDEPAAEMAPPAPPASAPSPAPPSPAPPSPAPPSPAPPAPAPPSAAPPSTAPAPPALITPEPAPLPPPEPPSTSQAEVRVQPPPAEPPPPPLVPDLALPTPPMPPPQPRARVAAPRPRLATPPPPATGTFANPMDLNFGSAPTRLAAPRMTAPRGSVASRSLDLSPGLSRSTPSRADAFFDARAAKLGADWEQGLMNYWLRHRYYPRQAAEDGEDGTVELELTVDGSGRVQSATVKSRSGSTWIDMAAVGTWRNAQLPPLPPELTVPYTFAITINYILLR